MMYERIFIILTIINYQLPQNQLHLIPVQHFAGNRADITSETYKRDALIPKMKLRRYVTLT